MNGTPFQYTQTPGVVPPGSITNAELADMAAHTVKARATNSTGSPEDVPIDATLVFPSNTSLGRAALTGDVTAAQGSNATTIANNAVTDAKFRQSAALSVVGRSANSTGDVADIAAGTDGHVLRRSGTTLGFGTLAAGAYAANTAPLSTLANASAQYAIVGRKTSSGGAWEDCTRAQLQLPGIPDTNVFTALNTINLNTTGSLDSSVFTQVLKLGQADGSIAGLTLDSFGSRTAFVGRRTNGTNSSRTGIVNADLLLQLIAQGWTSAGAYASGANFGFSATETWSSTATGCSFSIGASVNGATASTKFFVQGGLWDAAIGAAGDPGVGSIRLSGFVRVGQFTVATLPAAATAGAGALAYVTDALGPAFGAAVAGGGAVGVPVYSTGAAWNVG